MIKILKSTTEPLNEIGLYAGICTNADTSDKEKNIKRAIDCIESGHGRVLEYPDIILEISGYSARCIRELYTHVIGTTRTQESTRYVNYNNFDYYTPKSIENNKKAFDLYNELMINIMQCYYKLSDLGISEEDIANILPLGMYTKVVLKINLRALIHLFNERTCLRAYKEIRELCYEIKAALKGYSDEWDIICRKYLVSKCIANGRCTESRKPKECK